MIVRPFTFLTGLLFALSGAYLFAVKHQSQSLEDQLERLAEHSRQEEQAIRVLKAQWALEADPSRIAALATQFTGLQPMKPGQLVTLASLANALPAPGSPAPFGNPQDALPELPGSGDVPAPSGPPIEVKGRVAASQTADAAASMVPAKPASQLEQLADNAAPAVAVSLPKPPPVRPHVAAPRRVERAASIQARPHVAKAESQRHQTRPPSSVYEASAGAIAPVIPAPHPEKRLPMGAQVMRVRATAQPASVAPPAAPMGGGSLLGMAQTGSQN